MDGRPSAGSLPLGVLDLSKRGATPAPLALAAVVKHACAAEELGYRRYWVAEHHLADSSHSSLEVVAAVIAARTSRLRVGVGAVLLRYYSPFGVAETFLALECLFPGRIDLGIAHGPGLADPAVVDALVWGNQDELTRAAFEEKVRELCHWLAPRRRPADGDPAVVPLPVVDPPALWALGAGPDSADRAAAQGLPYAVAAFSDQIAEDALDRACGLIARYRRACDGEARPVILTVSVSLAGASATRVPANLVGSGREIVERIGELRSAHHIDEVMITTFSSGLAQRMDTYNTIAESWRDYTVDDRAGVLVTESSFRSQS